MKADRTTYITTYMKRRSTLPNTADDMMPMESTRSWWKRVIGSAINIVKTVMKRVLPVRMYTRLRREFLGVVDEGPGLDWERYCSLRRLRPIRPDSGWRSGLGVGRYYIDSFVAQHADDIKGRVLEVADRRYTTRFGADRVHQSDILHVKPGNPDATIIADLTDADHIPSHAFDCIILTQTLQYVFDPSLPSGHSSVFSSPMASCWSRFRVLRRSLAGIWSSGGSTGDSRHCRRKGCLRRSFRRTVSESNRTAMC